MNVEHVVFTIFNSKLEGVRGAMAILGVLGPSPLISGMLLFFYDLLL